MVGARIRTGVEQLTMFGDEDLPPKRKPQFVAKPELLIEIPESTEEEKTDFDEELANIVIEIGDYPNWQKILASFDYQIETEISHVEIASVEGRPLDGSGFREIHEAPAVYRVRRNPDEINAPAELADLLKNIIRDIAADLLAEEGIGSHELGYLYGVLMDHIRERLLNGKTVGTASLEELRHAINRRHQIKENVRAKPGLVSSVVKYKPEGKHANQ